ncbi:MAG: hypothetical protein IIA88_07515, partial [Bacteroidetes bacterium]|nr:hypothetical protein [Bacteroidota bacterium]
MQLCYHTTIQLYNHAIILPYYDENNCTKFTNKSLPCLPVGWGESTVVKFLLFRVLTTIIALTIIAYCLLSTVNCFSQSVKIETWYDGEKKFKKEEYHILNQTSNIKQQTSNIL